MKILHIATSLEYERGGPTTVVTELTQNLARKGIDITVFTTMDVAQGTNANNLEGVTIKTFPTNAFSKIWPYYSPSFKTALKKELVDYDLVHIHEIWHYPVFACYKVAKAIQKPYIITVHGSLEPSCLNYKAFKKKIYTVLIERKILEEASALHAVTEDEIQGIRDYVNNKNIYCVPNGINIQTFENLPDKSTLENIYPQIKAKSVILFLGRIHPKKGLDILAEAFGRIIKKNQNASLLIVGPDSDNYQSQIEKILARENVLDKTIFTGTLTGNRKLAALSRADVFVLPSHSEGFSMSILEAMGCGLPVVITQQCHFPEVEQIQAGRIIDGDADAVELSETIMELLNNPQLCRKMGKAGQQLVKNKYTWDKIVDKMISVYEEILNIQYSTGITNR